MIHRFSFPTTIHFGPGARGLVAEHLKAQGVSRPLVVTDRGIAPLPFLAEFVAGLSGLAVAVYSEVSGNPVKSQVERGAGAYKAHGADAVIGLGGGAALDVAKAVALMTCAKALTAGYLPMSATLVSRPIYDALLKQSDKLGVFGHGYTYSAHPVPAAVALETLKIYEERDIVGHVRRVGPHLQEGLRRLSAHPLVGEARGVGLIGALELVRDKSTRVNFDPKTGVGAYVVKRAQHHGTILRNMALYAVYQRLIGLDQMRLG